MSLFEYLLHFSPVVEKQELRLSTASPNAELRL